MRGKNKTRRLKLKRSKSHSLKLRKRKKTKTKKRGGAGKFTPGLKTVREGNASGVEKRPLARTTRKQAKTIAEVPPTPPPAASEYDQHQNFMKNVKLAKKLKTPSVAEMEDYGHFDRMAWL